MRTAKLYSSFGHIVFDVDTGFVQKDLTEYDCDCGGSEEEPESGEKAVPFKIDVDEWRQRYPGEDMAGEHDVLDFGFWYYRENPTAKRKRHNVDYEPPCEAWRKDREASIAEKKEVNS